MGACKVSHRLYTDSLGNINKWRQFERFAVKDGKVQRFAGSYQDIPEDTPENSR